MSLKQSPSEKSTNRSSGSTNEPRLQPADQVDVESWVELGIDGRDVEPQHTEMGVDTTLDCSEVHVSALHNEGAASAGPVPSQCTNPSPEKRSVWSRLKDNVMNAMDSASKKCKVNLLALFDSKR